MSDLSSSSPPDLWRKLRIIERRVQRRDLARALTQLNELAAEPALAADPILLGFFRCVIGDVQFKQGRFTEAAAAYTLVRAQYTSHQEGRLLMRGTVGEVRSLLRLSDRETAASRATAVVQVALVPAPHFDPPANGEPLTVHSVLPEAPVVAARLAAFFRREGFGAEADALVALAPGNDSHENSRRDRAAALFRAGDTAGAETLLLAALRSATSRNRTPGIRTWQLLTQVRRTLGQPLLLPAEIAAIAAIPGHRLRSRICLAMVNAAREAGDPAWRAWVSGWGLTAAPTPAALRLSATRLLLAEVRREGADFVLMRSLAESIMGNPKVTPPDYLAAARMALMASLNGAGDSDPLQLANAAGRKFGPSQRVKVLHSLGRAAGEALRPDVAALLYRKVRQDATPHAVRRSKATDALAVLSMEQEDFAAAASLSAELVADTRVPLEARFLALRRRCAALQKLGRDAALRAARAQLDTLIPADLPPSLLIRLARQVRLPGELEDRALSDSLIQRAVDATLPLVADAVHPAPALTLLLELNRKLYWDCSHFDQVLAVWEALGAERREWLWTERTAFWEYVSLVLRAAGKVGRAADAENLARMAADAPPEARPFVTAAYGDWKRECRQWPAAITAYASAIADHPTHVESARAHYWLGLRARQQGQTAQVRASLEAVQRCFGSGVALLWHWELDSRARLILAGGDAAAVAAAAPRYDHAFLALQISALAADEATLP